MDNCEFFYLFVSGKDYFRMDGSTGPDIRKKWCSYFNNKKNNDMRLFLISTKAGEYIKLTSSLQKYARFYSSKHKVQFYLLSNTTQNNQNKWTKILSLDHFWLKSDSEKWRRKIHFEFLRAPSELLLPSAEQSAQKG